MQTIFMSVAPPVLEARPGSSGGRLRAPEGPVAPIPRRKRSASPRSEARSSLGNQVPLAILELHQLAAAPVKSGMILRRHVVDALGADQLPGLLQRVAQRRAELRRSGLAFLRRFGH